MGNDPSKAKDGAAGTGSSGSISSINPQLRNKLSRGVNLNMKVLIKGERNTGKTSLWNMLQRKRFVEDHISTKEIQVATVDWSFKLSDVTVKVEVWDVVDKGRRNSSRQSLDSLKINFEDEVSVEGIEAARQEGQEHLMLDASTIDVMTGTHAVIFMVDPTKKWTFDYVMREMNKIPSHVWVLIVSNYKDLDDKRVVSELEIQKFAREAGSNVVTCEASMRNRFGVKAIKTFFNLPFLQMERQVLQKQLERNAEELSLATEEMDMIVDEQDYGYYVEWLNREYEQRKAAGKVQLPDKREGKNETSIVRRTGTPERAVSAEKGTSPPSKSPLSAAVSAAAPQRAAPPGRSHQAPARQAQRAPAKPARKKTPKEVEEELRKLSAAAKKGQVASADIDAFAPDDDDDGFWSDDDTPPAKIPILSAEGDDDDVDSNPLVAGFQDEIELEDLEAVAPIIPPTIKTAVADAPPAGQRGDYEEEEEDEDEDDGPNPLLMAEEDVPGADDGDEDEDEEYAEPMRSAPTVAPDEDIDDLDPFGDDGELDFDAPAHVPVVSAVEESPVSVAADIDVGDERDMGESEDSVSAPYILPVEDLPSDDESTAAPKADAAVRDRGEYDGFEEPVRERRRKRKPEGEGGERRRRRRRDEGGDKGDREERRRRRPREGGDGERRRSRGRGEGGERRRRPRSPPDGGFDGED